MLEERLKEDVLGELEKFGDRLLLHTETHDGSVIPVWEDVRPDSVEALREIMAHRVETEDGTRVHYRRIPITSERPPDFSDLSDLMEVVSRVHSTGTPIILNDQLGRGRSTIASVRVVYYSRAEFDFAYLLLFCKPRLLSYSFNSGCNSDKPARDLVNTLPPSSAEGTVSLIQALRRVIPIDIPTRLSTVRLMIDFLNRKVSY